MSKNETVGASKNARRDTKAERLAAALRKNLKKRKDLARKRAAGTGDAGAEGELGRGDTSASDKN